MNLLPHKQVKAPKSLIDLQENFGDTIRTPFLFSPEDNDYALQTKKYNKNTMKLMVPTKTLSKIERISTYNQQYWFRLFSVMQDEYPLLRHILGVNGLNQLTSAYLDMFPSTSPSLRFLSSHLQVFLQHEHEWNKKIIQQCVQLEYIYIEIFDAKNQCLNLDKLSETTINLNFQSHFFLFEEDYNLVESRVIAWKDKKDKVIIAIKEEIKYWALYQKNKQVAQEPLNHLQFKLLQKIYQGEPLEEACENMTSEITAEELGYVSANIQSWFQNWSNLGWFLV